MSDSILSQNHNLLQPTKYRLVLARLPNVVYWCQETELPGINLPDTAIQVSPFVTRYTPGDKLEYEPLSLSFQVDELLQNWLEIHNWMRALGKPTDYAERRSLAIQGGIKGTRTNLDYSDATIVVLSAKNNPTYEIQYKDCWPTQLTPIKWSAADSANDIITAQVTFRYLYYDIVRVS